jgi:hypothetical protein
VTSTDQTERTSEKPTSARRASALSKRATRWRLGGFGPASEEPYRRRVTDGIKLGIESSIIAYDSGLAGHTS